MTLKDYYDIIGDYDDVLARLMNENLIRKYVCKFNDDPSYHDLVQALKDEDYPLAFRHAHTLKGVAQNLGLKKLYKMANEITEILRDEKPHDVSENMQELAQEYDLVTSMIEQMKKEE